MPRAWTRTFGFLDAASLDPGRRTGVHWFGGRVLARCGSGLSEADSSTMTSSRSAEADAVPAKPRARAGKKAVLQGAWGLHAADALLVALFLGLTFLLGVFPMGDTDFWWHLRTGDLIRQTGEVPHVDPYLYGGPPEKPWIDLHWGFEVLLSLGYEWGGMVAVNLAKCVITTVAVFLLITARKRDWPLWVMILTWLPAVLLLSGRMYVRPETLTLLYMAIFLAVLFRIERWPWLAMILPVVQVLWVNSQGLFVLGPVVLGFALIDSACHKGAFRPERARWWGIMLSATLLTGLACLINPYGIRGALFPLALAGTMGNKVFESIGELRPILTFIRETGSFQNLSLQLHFALLGLGALSFLIPGLWQLGVWAESRRNPKLSAEPSGKGRKKRQSKAKKGEEPPVWRLSVFRLLLALAFSFLSFKATRNSHQFATVMGTVSAWNFGEWAAAIRARRQAR
ncbi:MAG TPA: hypothetical protein VFT74_15135, partial [Isosphaeraceae bacterium]|nr:hypothetical protein [Isosphaeraceae bacterium]